MFVKILFLVLLFNNFAFAESFQDFLKFQTEYISNVRKEGRALNSLTEGEAKAAIRRGKQQLHFARTELKRAEDTWGKKGRESSFYYLEDAADLAEEMLSQQIALSIGIGILQAKLSSLEKEGVIVNAGVDWLPMDREVTYGDFRGFPGPKKSGYKTNLGVTASRRQITVTYIDKKNQRVTITAIEGCHLQELFEVEKSMSAGTGVWDWLNADFTTLTGVVDNALTRFILNGEGVNFLEAFKTNGGWRTSEGFHTYYYGLIFIGNVKVARN